MEFCPGGPANLPPASKDYWVLEYYTLILFLVLGSHFFGSGFPVYPLKGRLQRWDYKVCRTAALPGVGRVQYDVVISCVATLGPFGSLGFRV